MQEGEGILLIDSDVFVIDRRYRRDPKKVEMFFHTPGEYLELHVHQESEKNHSNPIDPV